MRRLRAWFVRFGSLFRKQGQDEELAAELESHLQMHLEDNLQSGMTAAEARREALMKLGGLEQIKESYRERRGLPWLETLLQDLRYGARMLRKHPGFTVVAVLTLAFGIGANTVIFNLINTVLFKPVMAKEARQLISLYQHDSGGLNSGQWRHFSYPDFADLRLNHDIFADLAAVDFALVGLRDGGLNEMIPVCLVSANYFSVLGVPPALGRGFLPEEERSASLAGVLTHAFWERLGSDPAIIGRTLKLTRGYATVVGVMPRGFTGDRLAAPAMFLSLGAEDILNAQPNQPAEHILSSRAQRHFTVFGRLKEGLNLRRASAALSVLNGQFPQADPNEAQARTLVCTPLQRFDYHEMPESVERQAMPVAALAQALTLLILFITCLNLANMMLARGASRQKEIAVRLSLGAGRSRILRQLLTEGLMLASLGGGTGVLLSTWAARVLGTIAAGQMGMELPSRGSLVDWRLFAALTLFSVLATLFVALGPAWRLARLDFDTNLKREPGADTNGRSRGLLRVKYLLATGQVALVMAMLITAALFARSAMNAVRANPGFEFGANFFVIIDERATGDTEAQALELIRDASDRLRRLPGVATVSTASLIPFGPARTGRLVYPGDTPPTRDNRLHQVTYNVVGVDYFRTLGIPLLRGREFNRGEVDTTNAPSSVIISQKLADESWPGQDPLGQRLQLQTLTSDWTWRTATVVGVVANVDWDLFDRQRPAEVYEPPGGHFAGARWHLHVRAAPGAAAVTLMADCREALNGMDGRIPVPQIRTLKTLQRTNPQVLLMELGGGLFGIFGVVAAFLSFLGIYGLKAFEVARRTREIGIRVALGATRSTVARMVLRESAGLALWGMGLGFLLSLMVSFTARRFLYQVQPFDPMIYVAVSLFLMTVVLLAGWLPARRAAKVDPMVALRYE